MYEFIQHYGLDIATTLLGVIYIVFEYRASIWLWPVGVLMPLLNIFLFYDRGLYADMSMSVYSTLAALYGFLLWRFGKKKEQAERPITHIPWRSLSIATVAFLTIWAVIYYLLAHYTNSTVPMTDSFTNALEIVGLWALARKYVEQWFIWILMDAVATVLYFYKDMPFKGTLYAAYVIIAVAGYREWLRKMHTEQQTTTAI